MGLTNIKWSVTITHEPSGEQVTINNTNVRSKAKAKEKALALLKSRVFAIQKSLGEKQTFTYDIKEEQYPINLLKYRSRLK